MGATSFTAETDPNASYANGGGPGDAFVESGTTSRSVPTSGPSWSSGQSTCR